MLKWLNKQSWVLIFLDACVPVQLVSGDALTHSVTSVIDTIYYGLKMCMKGDKVYDGQHQNVSGHHPSFFEQKKQAAVLYYLQ